MANTYFKIASVTVGSGGSSSIAFSSIPSSYTDLVIKGSTRTNRSDALNDYIKIALNGSSASWTANFLQGTGSAVTGYTQSVAANIVAETNGDTSTGSTFGNLDLYILSYRSAENKRILSDSVTENKTSTAIQNLLGGQWAVTDAITSISLTPGVGSLFLQHSTAVLYGIVKS